MFRFYFFLKILSAFVTLYFLFSQKVFANDLGNHEAFQCPLVGSISGQILVPEDNTYLYYYSKEVVIRIAGIDYTQKDSDAFEYTPTQEGCFSIPSFFPVGTTLALYIWDKRGVLNSRLVQVYVGASTNYYTIQLTSYAYSSHLFELHDPTSMRSFAHSGFCATAGGLSNFELYGSRVALENSFGKTFLAHYFTADHVLAQTEEYLTESGRFCFFNLDPCSKEESQCRSNPGYYKLSFLLKNGEIRNYSVYLLSNSFANDLYFDLKAAVFRPTKVFSVKNFYDEGANSQWSLDNTVLASTSAHYAPVEFHNNNDLNYFPLTEDFVTISYRFFDQAPDRFFILKSRGEILNQRTVFLTEKYVPGQLIVDQKDDVILKVFHPDSVKSHKEFLDPLFVRDQGSVFVSLDLSVYDENKEFVSIFIKDIFGKEVSSFVHLNHVDKKQISGFFYNLEPGLYQLFALNRLNGKIFFGSVVQSFGGKTQVITNDVKNDLHFVKENEQRDIYVVNTLDQNFHPLPTEVIPWDEDSFLKAQETVQRNSLQEEFATASDVFEGWERKTFEDEQLNVYEQYPAGYFCRFTKIRTDQSILRFDQKPIKLRDLVFQRKRLPDLNQQHRTLQSEIFLYVFKIFHPHPVVE
jgi:hypothetical protein